MDTTARCGMLCTNAMSSPPYEPHFLPSEVGPKLPRWLQCPCFEHWLKSQKQLRQSIQRIAAVALLALVVANCGQAFIYPLELESREGSSWLYVLAARAGVDIYDQEHVAFLNMNHGPIDPLLKQALGHALPILTPAMVTRVFALLLPLGLYFAMLQACRAKRLTALIWALGLHLFSSGSSRQTF